MKESDVFKKEIDPCGKYYIPDYEHKAWKQI